MIRLSAPTEGGRLRLYDEVKDVTATPIGWPILVNFSSSSSIEEIIAEIIEKGNYLQYTANAFVLGANNNSIAAVQYYQVC